MSMLKFGLLTLLLVCGSLQSASFPRAWSPDQRLSFDPAASLLSPNFARTIATDERQRVHVTWYEVGADMPRVYYRRSTDGGLSFEPTTLLSSVAADQSSIAASGAQVYAAWHDMREGAQSIMLRRSDDGGMTWLPEIRVSSGGVSAHPVVVANTLGVYLVWIDSRSGHAEVYFRASSDLGETWGAETQLSEPLFDSWVPTLAVQGRSVYAAWVDTRDGNEEEYFRRSTDGGQTWGPMLRVTENGANSWAPSLAVSGDTVHMAWFDQQDSAVQPLEAERVLNAAMDLLGLRYASAPSGVMVDHPEEAARQRTREKLQQVNAAAPAFAAQGGDIERLRRILDELQALGPSAASYFVKEHKIDEAMRLLNLIFIPGPASALTQIHYGDALQLRVQDKLWQIQQAAPAWVAAGGSWPQLDSMLGRFQHDIERANNDWEIYYRRSTDGGLSFGPIQRMTEAPSLSMRPSLAVVGNQAHLVWFDARDGNAEIYFRESNNGGLSWQQSQRLTAAPDSSLHASVAASGNTLHVLWYDERDGNAEIYYKRSLSTVCHWPQRRLPCAWRGYRPSVGEESVAPQWLVEPVSQNVLTVVNEGPVLKGSDEKTVAAKMPRSAQ